MRRHHARARESGPFLAPCNRALHSPTADPRDGAALVLHNLHYAIFTNRLKKYYNLQFLCARPPNSCSASPGRSSVALQPSPKVARVSDETLKRSDWLPLFWPHGETPHEFGLAHGGIDARVVAIAVGIAVRICRAWTCHLHCSFNQFST